MLRWFSGAPPAVHQVVIVNLKSDPATGLRGVLVAARGGWLTLKKVDVVGDRGGAQGVDGDVLVHVDNVAFLQVPPPSA